MSFNKVDMQKINAQTVINPSRFFRDVQTQNQQKQLQVWDQGKHKLISYEIPKPIFSSGLNKKMRTIITYLDKRTGQTKHKTINFCKGNQFIFTKRSNQRFKILNEMKHRDNPLHSDYWRAIIGCVGPDFTENVLSAMKPMIQNHWREINQQREKKDYSQVVDKRKKTMIQRYGTDKPHLIHKG